MASKQKSLDGLELLLKRLGALSAQTGGKVLREATNNAATPVVAEAKLRVPVSSDGRVRKSYKGNLITSGFAKRSIKKRSQLIDGRAVVSIGVKKEAYYATLFVELGTRHQEAQPWLVPALEAQQHNVERRLIEQLRRKIDRVTRT